MLMNIRKVSGPEDGSLKRDRDIQTGKEKISTSCQEPQIKH